MTENRVPTGVPTGGQFAASTHSEADSVLLTQTFRASEEAAAVQRVDAVRAPLDKYESLIQHVDAADHIVDGWPDAAYAVLSVEYEENQPYMWATVYDADGNRLGLDSPPWGNHEWGLPDEVKADGPVGNDVDTHCMDLRKAKAVDLRAEWAKTTAQVRLEISGDTEAASS